MMQIIMVMKMMMMMMMITMLEDMATHLFHDPPTLISSPVRIPNCQRPPDDVEQRRQRRKGAGRRMHFNVNRASCINYVNERWLSINKHRS